MEYSTDSSFSSPTDCTGTEITGLSAGTYYIRVKATTTHEAGAYATVTVPAGGVATYTITINGGGSGATGSGSYIAGATVNIYAGNCSGYTFNGWTSSDVTITNASSKNASFTMPAKKVTVTANWSYSGGGGDSSDSSDDKDEPALVAKSSKTATGLTTYEVRATAGLVPKIVSAKAKGETSFAIDIEGALPKNAQVDVLTVRIPKNIVKSMAGLNVIVNTPYGNLGLPNALVEALAATGEAITFTMQQGDVETAMAEMGDGDELQGWPVEITTDLQGGVLVTLPCNLPLPADAAEREAFLASLYVLAIHGPEDVEQINALKLDIDEATDTLVAVTFWVDHFSTFALATAGTELQQPEEPLLKLYTAIDATTYVINDDIKAFDNLAAYRANGDTTVMAVRLLEELGAKIAYKRVDNIGVVTVSFGDITATLREKSTIMTVVDAKGTRQVSLRTVFTNRNGRTYLPTRDVAENLGFSVNWAAKDDSITITAK